jgi:Vitamin K-dependent gamma-carboxylase
LEGQQLVGQLLEGKASPWLQYLMEKLYPRLLVERHRLSVDFFVARGWQVLGRASIIYVFFLLVNLPFGKKGAVWPKVWQNLDRATCSPLQVRFFRIWFMAILLYYGSDMYFDLRPLSELLFFYDPIFPLSLVSFPWPGDFGLKALWLGFWLTGLLGLFGFRPALTVSLTVFLFMLMNALFQSFGKMWHPYVTLGYAGILLPFLLVEAQKMPGNGVVKAWPLVLIKVAIAFSYCLSGVEKCLLSGRDWLLADTVRRHVQLLDPGGILPIGQLPDFLLVLGSVLIVCFQLTFPLILLFPRLRWAYLPMGISFHAGTFFAIRVGTLFHPWVAMYIFFIDVESLIRHPIAKRLARKWTFPKSNI